MEYINKCTLEFNGQTLDDFESFTEGSVTVAKQVNLMNKTGHALMTPRYNFSINWKEPIGGFPFNPYTVRNATVTVEYNNGSRVDFGGVYSLDTGDATIDGETEKTNTATYGAESRNPSLG